MKQTGFHIDKALRNQTKFTKNEITITTDHFTYRNEKHYLDTPFTASAYFFCGNIKYVVENTDGIATVEDWYQNELLPKFQMLRLLMKVT
jgi:hypothetical protein